MRLWNVEGEDKLYDWFEKTLDADERLAMLDWVAEELSVDPAGAAHASKDRSPGQTLYTTDVDGTNAFVDFLIFAEYHTVMLLEVEDLSLRDESGDVDEG